MFKFIKIKYFKTWEYKGRMRKKKRVFLRKFFKGKHLNLKYKLLRKLNFKIFQFFEIIRPFNVIWAFKLKKYTTDSHINYKYSIINSTKLFTKNQLFYFKSFFKKQHFISNWLSFKKVYYFIKSFSYKYIFSDYMLSGFNKKFISLFFIPVKNPWAVKFNFKVMGFKKLVRENEESNFYKFAFKLAKKLIFKTKKKAFFILKMKHIRWLQTHMNFILDVRANVYYPRFIFFGQSYLKRLYFFRTIFNEYWLAKYLFYTKNNRRWVKFFKLFKPNYYIKKLRGFNIQRLQRLNSTQFNWFIRTQKLSLLKYYYLIKYSKLSFFFFFYLKLFWKQIFNVELTYAYRRFKFQRKTEELLKSIYSNYRSFESQLNPSFFLYEILEILFISMKTKNSYFFHKWMCEKIGKIYYRKHFKVLHLLSSVISKYFDFFKHHYNVKGVQYIVKGKINMKGSVRKRKVTYQVGKVSYSDLNIKNSSNFGVARTDTGVLGIFFLVAF